MSYGKGYKGYDGGGWGGKGGEARALRAVCRDLGMGFPIHYSYGLRLLGFKPICCRAPIHSIPGLTTVSYICIKCITLP